MGVLFGGESAEHEVSLQSAANIVEAIDREKYEVVLIGIDKRGRWLRADDARFLLEVGDPRRIRLGAERGEVVLPPGRRAGALLPLTDADEAPEPAPGPDRLDVVFPVLHGPRGEDGSVQGLLRLAHLPFVGSGILGSAVAMDKEVAKRLLREAGIPTPRSVALRRREAPPSFEALTERLGPTLFVKPANLGSSVGVHRVREAAQLDAALEDAFAYDRKVLVEEAVRGREVECAVLGNEEPAASVPGEVVPRHDFYSYEAKYLDEAGAELVIPADLPEETARKVQALSVAAFRALGCEGMARVDFFLRADGELLVNELNSIPGFTRISMYPKLWAASGIGYAELIDRLISLALERDAAERGLRSSYRM